MPTKPGSPQTSSAGDDFDTTAQLWDRIVDDISRQGAPCLDTVEALVDEACHRPPRPDQSKPPQD